MIFVKSITRKKLQELLFFQMLSRREYGQSMDGAETGKFLRTSYAEFYNNSEWNGSFTWADKVC